MDRLFQTKAVLEYSEGTRWFVQSRTEAPAPPKHSQAASAPGPWFPEHRDEEMPHCPSLGFTAEPAEAGGTGSRVTPNNAECAPLN